MSEPILDELISSSLQQSPELHVHILAEACIRRDHRIAELERGAPVVVPSEGQVAVDRERLRILERIATVVGLATGEDHPSKRWPMLAELWAELDALRAQAGKESIHDRS